MGNIRLRRSFPVWGGNQWRNVTPPTGWTWTLPFTIQRNGNSIRVDPSFDLQTYAAVTVTKTYYVDRSRPNDAGDGLTWATAFQKISTALAKADVDRIYVKRGVYELDYGWNNIKPNRNVEVIAVDGYVYSSQGPLPADLSWSAVDTHYTASYAGTVGVVVDTSVLDADGDGVPLVHVVSEAAVEAAAGTWYYDAVADILYVRTLDDREPDANIYAYINSAGNGRLNVAHTYYVEGLIFDGGGSPFICDFDHADTKGYFKDCGFRYSDNATQVDSFKVTGCTEIICQDCFASRNGGDGFKAQSHGGFDPRLALIDCVARNNGLTTSTNSNGYSRHGPGSTVGINCTMFGNWGPNQKDINTGTLTWLLGWNNYTPAPQSQAYNFGVGDTTATAVMWLDSCVSSGTITKDLYIGPSATIYIHSMTPASPSTDGGGTLATY